MTHCPLTLGVFRGSGIASILSVKHSDRFMGFVFTVVTYFPPSVFPPLEMILEFQRQKFGRPLMGYWTFFRRGDAATLIENNIASFLEHYEHIKSSLLRGGLNSPLNWYRSNLQGVHNGIQANEAVSEDDIKIKNGLHGLSEI